MSVQTCASCDCDLRPGRTFSFRSATAEVFKCFRCSLLHRPMLRRSLLTALVVGTILTLLNQGNIIFAGSWEYHMYWKTPLTYCVPFLVATWGALTNSRR